MITTTKKLNKLIINTKSFSPIILKYYLASFFYIFKSKKYKFKMQPIKYKNLTLLKSPHKHKKAQNHFHLKIYKNTLIIENINISELLLLLNTKPQGLFITIKAKQVLN